MRQMRNCGSFRAGLRAAAAAVLLVAMGGALLGGCERKTRDTDIQIISLSEMKTLMDRREGQIVLVDPRPVAAYEAGHIPGARNIQLPQVPPQGGADPSLAAYRHIVVYGEDPGSAVARGMTKRLLAVGHRGVRLYAGGMREWRGRGFEVARVASAGPDEPRAAEAGEAAPQ
jgi:rhodanese-related sulfurtransferase